MTAPALPGAAPDPAPGRNDPARLPPEVEEAIDEAVNAIHDAGNAYGSDYWPSSEREFARITSENAIIALRTAIRAALDKRGAASPAAGASARAVGGDGEPVAWAVRSGTGEYDTFRWTAAEAHEEVARLNSDEYGHDVQKVVKRRPFTVAALFTRPAATGAEVERAVKEERAWFLDADLGAALDRLTDDERAVLPLNVQEDARPRVKLAHIESDEGAPAGQGTAVVSVPSKYARLAWAMVCAINAAIRARGEARS